MIDAKDFQKEKDWKTILFLKGLIEKYDKQIESLKELKHAAEILLVAEEGSSMPLKSTISQIDDKLYAGMSAADAAADYLEKTGNDPIESEALTQVLMSRGWRSNAKDPRSTVSSALSRDARFEKSAQGGYRLKEKYGAQEVIEKINGVMGCSSQKDLDFKDQKTDDPSVVTSGSS